MNPLKNFLIKILTRLKICVAALLNDPAKKNVASVTMTYCYFGNIRMDQCDQLRGAVT